MTLSGLALSFIVDATFMEITYSFSSLCILLYTSFCTFTMTFHFLSAPACVLERDLRLSLSEGTAIEVCNFVLDCYSQTAATAPHPPPLPPPKLSTSQINECRLLCYIKNFKPHPFRKGTLKAQEAFVHRVREKRTPRWLLTEAR